jgi:hypothetical protein
MPSGLREPAIRGSIVLLVEIAALTTAIRIAEVNMPRFTTLQALSSWEEKAQPAGPHVRGFSCT